MGEKLRLCVLVLAHKNLEQLQQLTNLLAEEYDVFVHIDSKTSFLPKDVHTRPNIQAIKKHRTNWGSVQFVYAALDLMSLAQKTGYDRYVLISGQDLPIKKLSYISRYFSMKPSINFVHSVNLRDWSPGGLERVTHWHFRLPHGTTGLTSLVLKSIDFVLRKTQDFFHIQRNLAWEFYGGGNWVDLTGDTVQKILHLVQQEPRFLRRFRGTANADEVFFQTAIHYLGLESTTSHFQTRFVDWQTGPESPRILRHEDLNKLLESEALFARKFDPEIDQLIAEDIVRRLGS
jgi:hypothetical protein